jgi:SPOR domain
MAERIAASEPPRRPFLTAYVIVWGLLASLAFAYLGALVLRPELVAQLHARLPAAEREAKAAEQALHLATEARERLGQLEQETGRLRAAIAVQDERTQAVVVRLAQVEERSSAAALAVHPATAPPPRVVSRSAPSPQPGAGPQDVDGQTVQGQVEDAPVAATAAPQRAPEVKQPIRFGMPQVRPASGPVAVQIASGASLDDLRLSWALLSERHKGVLKNVAPHYTGYGESYQLLAGPVANAQEAQRICAALHAKRVPCSVTPFAGEAL